MSQIFPRLDAGTRKNLWSGTGKLIESYLSQVDELPVERLPEPAHLRDALKRFDFSSPLEPETAIAYAAESMRAMQTHVSHKRYFGLFNPAPSSVGIIGEALTAAFNPNVAAWSHSPFAVAAEDYVCKAIGSRFGPDFRAGTFTSGGGEANFTAFLCALTAAFPSYQNAGLRGLAATPVAYVSEAAHHSLVKAARSAGLGLESVRVIPCDGSLRMDIGELQTAIDDDRANGRYPFFVVGTAGATATGIIESLPEIAYIAQRERMWFHVDAAWGGLAAFVPELKIALRGIDAADSITFDPHKSLSVPMGAGLFLTRHEHILGETFSIAENYMPPRTEEGDKLDPYVHSPQWSRRFAGLKVLLSLAVCGWDGYAATLRHQVAMGRYLRAALTANGMRVLNSTPLPLACFVAQSPSFDATAVAREVVERGHVWISPTTLPSGRSVLRAAITNYLTQRDDVDVLVEEVVRASAAAA